MCETLREGDLWEARNLLCPLLRKSNFKLRFESQRTSAPQNTSTACCLQGVHFFYSVTWHPPSPPSVNLTKEIKSGSLTSVRWRCANLLLQMEAPPQLHL